MEEFLKSLQDKVVFINFGTMLMMEGTLKKVHQDCIIVEEAGVAQDTCIPMGSWKFLRPKE